MNDTTEISESLGKIKALFDVLLETDTDGVGLRDDTVHYLAECGMDAVKDAEAALEDPKKGGEQ